MKIKMMMLVMMIILFAVRSGGEAGVYSSGRRNLRDRYNGRRHQIHRQCHCRHRHRHRHHHRHHRHHERDNDQVEVELVPEVVCKPEPKETCNNVPKETCVDIQVLCLFVFVCLFLTYPQYE